MKKNAMLKVAAVVLVAVLLTTCAISSTFAKYVTNTTDEAEASARVAKWGVEVDAGFASKLNDLFKPEYSTGTSSTTTGNVEVSATWGGGELVAPGTNSSVLFTSAVTGTPEVSGVVKVTADVKLENWAAGADDDYCPLVFTVGTEDYYIGKSGITTSAELATEVAKAIATKGTQYFEAGATLDAGNDIAAFDIGWAWALNAPTENVADGQNDDADTLLGNAAAASITITIGVSVEQTGPAVA
jgi:hypothetical protein